MVYQRARSLRSDRAVCMLGLRVLIELGLSTVRLSCSSSSMPVGYVSVVLGKSVFGSTEIRIIFYRKALRKDFFTKITFRKNVHTDFYGLSDIDSVVADFDPNNSQGAWNQLDLNSL